METTKDQESLLNNILPPRLEDAGLEDCALHPDLIKQAFFKAASAVKSRATSIFSDGDEEAADCVQDPWPDTAKGYSDEVIGGVQPEFAGADVLVGVENEKEVASGTCVVEKGGGLVEEGGDKVVVVGGDVEGREKDKDCVREGLKGLKIGEGCKKTAVDGGDNADGEEKGDGEKPTLTEGFI